MKTCADAVKQAREILLDVDATNGYRYSDADLLSYIWDADQLARSLRPDLYIGKYLIPAAPDYALTDPFPLPDKFFLATTTYIAGLCELRDTEYSVDGRAASFISSMAAVLVKGM